jgi:hypothetical protein
MLRRSEGFGTDMQMVRSRRSSNPFRRELAALAVGSALYMGGFGCGTKSAASDRSPKKQSVVQKGVHIPFRVVNYMIAVPAVIDGKPIECWLDTGQTNITWPETLDFRGKVTGTSTQTMAGGSFKRTKLVTLPEVRLGKVVLKNVTTTMLPMAHWERETARKAGETEAVSYTKPILGNDAFRQLILTIDYRSSEIVLEKPEDRNIAKELLGPGDQLLGFSYDWGNPEVVGKLDNRPAKIIIDTGCSDLMVAEEFCRKHVARSRMKDAMFYGGFGPRKREKASDVSLELGKMTVNRLDGWAVKLASDADAMLGYEILKLFRVTIDYPRKKLFLHLYLGERGPGHYTSTN